MATTSIHVAAAPVEKHRLVSPSLVVRLGLSAIAVLVCYQFHWEWLRGLTCDLNLRLDALFGVQLQKIAFDTVVYRGVVYHYVVACTMVDAFCGTIPLIWNTRQTVLRNLGLVSAVAACMLVFNVSRLSFSDILFAQGLSWNWAHNVVSGVCYFMIWEWILTRKTLAVAPEIQQNSSIVV